MILSLSLMFLPISPSSFLTEIDKNIIFFLNQRSSSPGDLHAVKKLKIAIWTGHKKRETDTQSTSPSAIPAIPAQVPGK